MLGGFYANRVRGFDGTIEVYTVRQQLPVTIESAGEGRPV
jgi:hypothetical protein